MLFYCISYSNCVHFFRHHFIRSILFSLCQHFVPWLLFVTLCVCRRCGDVKIQRQFICFVLGFVFFGCCFRCDIFRHMNEESMKSCDNAKSHNINNVALYCAHRNYSVHRGNEKWKQKQRRRNRDGEGETNKKKTKISCWKWRMSTHYYIDISWTGPNSKWFIVAIIWWWSFSTSLCLSVPEFHAKFIANKPKNRCK